MANGWFLIWFNAINSIKSYGNRLAFSLKLQTNTRRIVHMMREIAYTDTYMVVDWEGIDPNANLSVADRQK